MAEIGYGYGSEFQLLRFLGHHRIEFESIISKNSRFKENLKWLDFPYENHRISMDGEFKGITFLKDRADYPMLQRKWESFWPQKGNSQNWDAVFVHKDEYVLIEAKAHMNEVRTNSNATNKESIRLIQNAFILTKEQFEIKSTNDWSKKYYQLANRLAFLKFMIDNNIKAHLLNIYFLNGYTKRSYENRKTILEDKNVLSQIEWQKTINKQYEYLGIKESEIKNYITSIFVNCKK
ncbi:MAG: hypothetical protein WC389_05500 [Lutibacter sp.]|jgi:hypothetical protein